MQVTLFHGYPDMVGRRSLWSGTGNGPTSYTGGNSPTDTIVIDRYQYYIDSVAEISISASGTYYAIAQPGTVPIATAAQASLNNPRATWFLRYFTTATGAEVGNHTNLSAEKFTLSGFGGQF